MFEFIFDEEVIDCKVEIEFVEMWLIASLKALSFKYLTVLRLLYLIVDVVEAMVKFWIQTDDGHEAGHLYVLYLIEIQHGFVLGEVI